MREALLGAPTRVYTFLHPPSFLLLVLPFGLLPYFAAMASWVATTGIAFLAVLRAWGAGRAVLVAALLSPASIINAAHGQTGYLTAALLGLAGLGIGARPWLAGLAFALLATKPQLGVLVLPALLAARRWPEIGWGAGFLGLFAVVSLASFGPEAWRDFLALALAYQDVVRGGALEPWKLQSVAAFATTAGLGGMTAAMLQAVVAVAVVVAVMAVLRRRPGGRAEAAAIAAGLPLVTPYILMYDLVILLVPMAWVLAEARRTGFLPWEKTVLLLALLVPGLALAAGLGAGVSVTAPVAAALLAVVLRRIRAG
nr:glycosyltransferase family 87 protein [Neoroseomonas eburnea]